MACNLEEEELVRLVEKHLTMRESATSKRLSISPSPEVKQFERTLFFKILTERTVKSRSVIEVFQKVWAGDGSVQIKLFSDGVWIAIFELQEDLDRALDMAPWHFSGDLLLLHEGNSSAIPSDLKFTVYGMWVHFLNLPLEFCNEDSITRMAELVGNVIRVECNASNDTFTNRAYIEFEVGASLTKRIVISPPNGNMLIVPLSYEKLPRFCTFCGCPGHSFGKCNTVSMLRRQIEKVKDAKKRSELMSRLKPRYDNSMYYRKLSTSKEGNSNNSESSSIPCPNDIKSQSESASSSSTLVILPIQKLQPSLNELAMEEVNSYAMDKLEGKHKYSSTVEQLGEESLSKNLSVPMIVPAAVQLEVAKDVEFLIAEKEKSIEKNTSLRKWKKVIRGKNKNINEEIEEVVLLISQIQQDLKASSQSRKKRKMNVSPKITSPPQKLKKAVGEDLLPDYK